MILDDSGKQMPVHAGFFFNYVCKLAPPTLSHQRQQHVVCGVARLTCSQCQAREPKCFAEAAWTRNCDR